jgi:hypothetical protein
MPLFRLTDGDSRRMVGCVSLVGVGQIELAQSIVILVRIRKDAVYVPFPQ